MRKGFWKTMLWSLGYFALALSCLVRWATPHPLSRITVFSGGYLALRFMGSLHSLISSRRVFDSQQVRQEWWAASSSPGWNKWVAMLMLADLTIFLDYAHWHLVAALERPVLQGLGMVVYVTVAIWQMWADTHLAKYFACPQPVPMQTGPYRYMRHPRYAAAMLGKVAVALVFASVLGWLLALAWAVLLFRKMNVEEAHLRRLFGAEYATYSQTTARLLPGIY
jgi:protein-S-isoprenylcysteine O-methyltransferase Ste14